MATSHPSTAEAQAAINAEILTIVMLESPEAVSNADAIAAVPGVDVLFIGTSDLTAELGISGQMGHAKVIDAYQTVGDACRKHGKTLGMGGVYDEENAAPLCRHGRAFPADGLRSQLHRQSARTSARSSSTACLAHLPERTLMQLCRRVCRWRRHGNHPIPDQWHQCRDPSRHSGDARPITPPALGNPSRHAVRHLGRC